MVLASIHQPSFATLNEFTSLVLLSQGSLCYKGKVGDLEPFLLEIGVGSAPFVSYAATTHVHVVRFRSCRSSSS